MTPNGNFLYVTQQGPDAVLIIDTFTNQTARTGVFNQPWDLAIGRPAVAQRKK